MPETPNNHYSGLEAWSEWISVAAFGALLLVIALGRLEAWLLVVGGGITLFGVVLQLTRPLRTEDDLGAVFRLAYAFALVIGLGAPLGLVLLKRPFVSPDPVAECERLRDEKDKAADEAKKTAEAEKGAAV